MDWLKKQLTSEGKATAFDALLIIAAVFLVYANTLGMGFVWDDSDQIIRNTIIHDWSNAGAWFQNNVWNFAGDQGGYYRPLFTASLATDYAFWGENPAGYHATNLLLHGLNCLGLWWLGRRLLGGRWIPLLAALLFAVHPLHGESVSWISGRTDLLAGVFVWPAILLYWRSGRGQVIKVHAVIFYMIALIAFAGSLLSKEVAILLPVGLWLHDLWIAKLGLRRSTLRAFPFGLAVIGFMLLRQLVVGAANLNQQDILTHLMTGPVLIARYIGLLLVPHPQKLFYQLNPVENPLSISLLLAILLLGVLVAFTIWSFRKSPAAAWLVVLFGLFIFPVSGFVYFTRPALMAERYLYLPSAAFCLLLAWGLVKLWQRWVNRKEAPGWIRRAWAPAVASAILLLALGTKAALRNILWTNDEHFVSRMALDAPNHVDSYNALGVIHFRRQRYQESVQAYEHALSLAPGNCDVIYNLGLSYERLGQIEAALQRFEMATLCRPNFSYAWFMRGRIAQRQNQHEQAQIFYETAVRLNPTELTFQRALRSLQK